MRLISLASVTVLSLWSAAAVAAPAYKLAAALPLGAPDRWDYVVFNQDMHRIYVAHGDRVTVVDPAKAAIVGQVEGIPGGTHGVAISMKTGEGFTDDGKAGKAIAFDLASLKITGTIAADLDADAIAFDKATGHVFVIEGDPAALTVIDPTTDTAIATINVGEKLEYGVGDDSGSIFVAGEKDGDVVKIDAVHNRVAAHFSAPGCTSPHGLAIDARQHRLFMGCSNKVMMVVAADTGRLVATLPIGPGNDAVAYDPIRRRVFSSNGIDGTISVFQQRSPDSYRALEPIQTAISGRTMALDPESGRLFVAAADTDPSATPGGRPRPRPGTLKLLMFDPMR